MKNRTGNDDDDKKHKNSNTGGPVIKKVSLFQSISARVLGGGNRNKKKNKNNEHSMIIDEGLELHAMGATQQFIEVSTPVRGILAGKLFYRVAKDIYLEVWKNKKYLKKKKGDDQDVKVAGEEDDDNNEEEKEEEEEADGNYSDQTPMLLIGLKTIEKDDHHDGLHNSMEKITLAPPNVKSYKLRYGDRLFVIADDMEEVNVKMNRLINYYINEERKRKMTKKKPTRETINRRDDVFSFSDSIIPDRKVFKSMDSRGMKVIESSFIENNLNTSTKYSDDDFNRNSYTRKSCYNEKHRSSFTSKSYSTSSTGGSGGGGGGGNRNEGGDNQTLVNKEYWKRKLLGDWLGGDDDERTKYVRSIMYPSIDIPVTIEKIRSDYDHAILCHHQAQELDTFLKKSKYFYNGEQNTSNGSSSGDRVSGSGVGSSSSETKDEVKDDDHITVSNILNSSNSTNSLVQMRVETLSKQLNNDWNTKEYICAKINQKNNINNKIFYRIRPLRQYKNTTTNNISNAHSHLTTTSTNQHYHSKHKNKKKNIEETNDGRRVLQLDHVPMNRCEDICRFNLKIPGHDQLQDHVVICHCNVAANGKRAREKIDFSFSFLIFLSIFLLFFFKGHHIICHFSNRGVRKICFITNTLPRFEVWGDLVTQRKDCQVYFVVGEITDVTVLKNANVGAACAVIILFPDKDMVLRSLNYSSNNNSEQQHFSNSDGSSKGGDDGGGDNEKDGEQYKKNLQLRKEKGKTSVSCLLYFDKDFNPPIHPLFFLFRLLLFYLFNNIAHQALDQRQSFATSLVENNFVVNGVNPTLEMTLITEMSRDAIITGKFNHREATGRLFSHLDFVSLLAVRYHFRHFLELAFSAIDQIELIECPEKLTRRVRFKRRRHQKKTMKKKRNFSESETDDEEEEGGDDDVIWENGIQFGELVSRMMDEGMIIVGILRYLIHPNDDHADAGMLFPCVITNPPKGNTLIYAIDMTFFVFCFCRVLLTSFFNLIFCTTNLLSKIRNY